MATNDVNFTQSSSPPPKLASGETTGLVRIQVDGLLGRYSYRIPPTETIPASDSQLIILYGDNGSGKTTLLRLVFHLLSPSNERGHVADLLSTPFTRLKLELADGTALDARRSVGDSAQPPYLDVTITRDNQTLAAARYGGARKEVGETATPEQISLTELIATTRANIGIDVYFLTDNRRLLSDVLPVEEEPSAFLSSWAATTTATTPRRRLAQAGKEVSDAMGRASEWIFRAAVGQTGQGDRGANTIYEEVITQIAAAKPGRPSVSREDLANRLVAVGQRTSEFAEFGLMAPFNSDRLVNAVQSVPGGRLGTVRRILLPYIEGLDARTEALRPIKDLIDTFVSTINSFFVDKALRYSLSTGLQVATIGTSRTQVLDPDGLSSGERQLLLLFCNVLPARDRKSLFIIDEPELSLNVKWQRQLVASLLRCTEGSDIQFLLATHSIELLTQHQRNVQRLTAG